MKKVWKKVAWEDIRAGDVIDGIDCVVKHIGDRYFKIDAKHGVGYRYVCDNDELGENQWQRQETEKEPADYEAEIRRLKRFIVNAKAMASLLTVKWATIINFLQKEIESWEEE